MFKKLVPFIALAVIAVPAFAADEPAPAAMPATHSGSHHSGSHHSGSHHSGSHHSHHSGSSKSSSTPKSSPSAADDMAPAK